MNLNIPELLKTNDIDGLKIAIEKIKKYFYEDDHYNQYSYIEEIDEEVDFKTLLETILKHAKELNIITSFQIEEEDGFDSPGYENSFLAYSFTNGEELILGTILFESY